MRKFRISDKETCPCGSGIFFKDCCKNKDIVQKEFEPVKKHFDSQIMAGTYNWDIYMFNKNS